MVIVDKKGRKRERYFNLWKKHYPEIKNGKNKAPYEDRSLIKFFRPSDVKGTALLTKSFGDNQEDMQWIYFPFSKMLKRLSSGDKHKSFMGSDFSYADIAGRRIDEDVHTLVKETEEYFVVDSVPKDSEDTYSKIVSVIEKKRMIPIKTEFYGHKKEADATVINVKTLFNKAIMPYKGMQIVTESIMKNHVKNTYTILSSTDIEVGLDISDNLVGLKGLQRQ